MIELDNLYWIFEDDPGITDINDPFSNLLHEERLPRLIRDYTTWCIDMRLCELREGKMAGSSRARTGARDSIFLSRLQSSPNYLKNLRTQASQAKKEFERLAKEAKRELNLSVKMYREGELSFAELQRDTANFFEGFYERVWMAGRKSSGLDLYMPESKPTMKEKEWLRSAIREELTYWQSFMKEMKKGDAPFDDTLSPDQKGLSPPRRKWTVEERIGMYLKGLAGVFENGRVSGMPSNLLFYWYGPKPKSPGICAGCTYIVERQPFTKSTLPAVPLSSATPCLSRCRHKLVVRKAKLEEVAKRDKVLPKKESMVRQLRSIMKGGPRFKTKGKLVNPWKI